MEYGQKIGNTTDYFVNPCPYTVKYYAKQINTALKQAFKENPGWMKPGSKSEVLLILAEIQEWYNPFLFTDLVSSTFDQLWSQALRELQDLLVLQIPKARKCVKPQSQDRRER